MLEACREALDSRANDIQAGCMHDHVKSTQHAACTLNIATLQVAYMRYLWTFRGFSSSSLRAFTFVHSCRSCLPRLCTSRLRTLTSATDRFKMLSSRLRSLNLIFSTRISFSRSLYCDCPLERALCWILIFSYSNANSSFLRINCVPTANCNCVPTATCFQCLPRNLNA